MKKSALSAIVPAAVILINLILILTAWKNLPDTLPAHFDPQGNASGSMPRNMLLFYPLVSAAICLVSYAVYALIRKMFHTSSNPTGMQAFTCGIALMILSSTCLTLTMGQASIFMFMEPVFLIAGIVILCVTAIRSHRSNEQ